eukprot:c15473_g1_i2.p1 GENE.c15473_g1_i2~~c15473_g1_i2.p1  ORF type:complete len:190 (+),score=62.74 c15473_g1_i2:55-570(+)
MSIASGETNISTPMCLSCTDLMRQHIKSEGDELYRSNEHLRRASEYMKANEQKNNSLSVKLAVEENAREIMELENEFSFLKTKASNLGIKINDLDCELEKLKSIENKIWSDICILRFEQNELNEIHEYSVEQLKHTQEILEITRNINVYEDIFRICIESCGVGSINGFRID